MLVCTFVYVSICVYVHVRVFAFVCVHMGFTQNRFTGMAAALEMEKIVVRSEDYYPLLK